MIAHKIDVGMLYLSTCTTHTTKTGKANTMNTNTIRKALAAAALVIVPASAVAVGSFGTAGAATAPTNYTISVKYMGNNGYQIAARNFSAASSTASDEVGLEVDGVETTFHKTFSSHGTWTVAYRTGHHITVRAIDRTDPNFDGVAGHARSNDWDFTTGGTPAGNAVHVTPFYAR